MGNRGNVPLLADGKALGIAGNIWLSGSLGAKKASRIFSP
jgi:hypothetical protein